MITFRGDRGKIGKGIRSLIGDRRGAAAFEVLIVYSFLIFSLLLPLADVAIAGFHYVSAWQALRAFGQSIQYNPPPDFADVSDWTSDAISKADAADGRYPISSLEIYCVDKTTNAAAICTADNAPNSPVKYFSYATTVTLAPMVLSLVLCPGGNCTYTLPHSERFQ